MLQLSGGLSETTVDAESTPKNTEINKTPEVTFTVPVLPM